jgi:hypothetical protein
VPASGPSTTDPDDASPLVVVEAAPGAAVSSIAMIEACTDSAGGSSRAIAVIVPRTFGAASGLRVETGQGVEERCRQEPVEVDGSGPVRVAVVGEERGHGMHPQRRHERVGHPTGIPTPGPSFGVLGLPATVDVVQVTPVSGRAPERGIVSGGP